MDSVGLASQSTKCIYVAWIKYHPKCLPALYLFPFSLKCFYTSIVCTHTVSHFWRVFWRVSSKSHGGYQNLWMLKTPSAASPPTLWGSHQPFRGSQMKILISVWLSLWMQNPQIRRVEYILMGKKKCTYKWICSVQTCCLRINYICSYVA